VFLPKQIDRMTACFYVHLYINMHLNSQCFTPFKQSIKSLALPPKFTFPFYYEPHPLCLLAVEELQQHLKTQNQWQHNFGIDNQSDTATGKMFGVLLVQNPNGDIGYLSAFSGNMANKSTLPNFVPPVFDLLSKENFFTEKQAHINNINDKIVKLKENSEIQKLNSACIKLSAEADAQIEACKNQIIIQRKKRKSSRSAAEKTLNNTQRDYALIIERLAKESVAEKNQLKALKYYWNKKISAVNIPLTLITDEIITLKNTRKKLSAALQQWIFEQYRFLNSQGDAKSLSDIFITSATGKPPAGAGECAAPKLLHHAFLFGMKPLAMAEFWWGASPSSEVRRHKNFYPSCLGKCKPILKHMLNSIEIDDNPLLVNPAVGKNLKIIYQDEVMLVINKPTEFLSVPGKNIKDCVYERIKNAFPTAEGPLIVHRLDMSTSGLMVIALTKQAHKNLQQQFIKRSVSKRYVALLDGLLTSNNGTINLPLRVDLNDRPRQLVCYQHGKSAETSWQVIAQQGSKTKISLVPKTGRTHQLRVHCAHVQGLNTPILGDDLYGKKSERLHLHAQFLAFNHPCSNALMQFEIAADF